LRNAVQRAYVMSAGELIDEHCLPDMALTESPPPTGADRPLRAAPVPAVPADATGESITLPIGTSMAQAERALMLATLRHYNHHKERTAAVLGISLKTLYNRLKEYAAEKAATHDGDPDGEA
jgi:DNA-binding NtrC family response regulator